MIEEKHLQQLNRIVSNKANELSKVILRMEEISISDQTDDKSNIKTQLIHDLESKIPQKYNCDKFQLFNDKYTATLYLVYNQLYKMSITLLVSGNEEKCVLNPTNCLSTLVLNDDSTLEFINELDSFNEFVHLINGKDDFWTPVKEVLSKYYKETNKNIIELDILQNKKEVLSKELNKLNMAKEILSNTLYAQDEGKPDQYLIVNKTPKVVGTVRLLKQDGVMMEILSKPMDDDKEAWKIVNRYKKQQPGMKYHVYNIRKMVWMDEPYYF